MISMNLEYQVALTSLVMRLPQFTLISISINLYTFLGFALTCLMFHLHVIDTKIPRWSGFQVGE